MGYLSLVAIHFKRFGNVRFFGNALSAPVGCESVGDESGKDNISSIVAQNHKM